MRGRSEETGRTPLPPKSADPGAAPNFKSLNASAASLHFEAPSSPAGAQPGAGDATCLASSRNRGGAEPSPLQALGPTWDRPLGGRVWAGSAPDSRSLQSGGRRDCAPPPPLEPGGLGGDDRKGVRGVRAGVRASSQLWVRAGGCESAGWGRGYGGRRRGGWREALLRGADTRKV